MAGVYKSNSPFIEEWQKPKHIKFSDAVSCCTFPVQHTICLNNVRWLNYKIFNLPFHPITEVKK